MASSILIIGLLPFGLAFLLLLPRTLRQILDSSASIIWLGIAWTAMFVGQAQIFGHTDQGVVSVSNLGVGALYQLSWMGVAGLILAYMVLVSKIQQGALRFPLLALLIYAVLGIAGSVSSIAPQLAAYKAFQVFMDAILSIVVLSYLISQHKPRAMVELTYFWLLVLVASAALGGLLVPELAFKEIGNESGSGGVFGGFLRGVYPVMAANELGLMSGIVVIISVRRAFEPSKYTIKIFWVTAALLGVSVALLAQSRTSLASSLIALIILSWSIRRMRWIAIVSITGFIIILGSAIVQKSEVLFADDIAKYARRGSTDEQLKNLSGRTILFKLGLKMSADKPFFGHGFETGARLAGTPYGISRGSNMHNAHMQVLVDSGYIGYMVWLGFLLPSIWIVWSWFWRQSRKLAVEENRFYLECSLVIFIIFFRSFFGHVLVSHQQNLLIFLAIVISVLASSKLSPKVATQGLSVSFQHRDGILSRKTDIGKKLL